MKKRLSIVLVLTLLITSLVIARETVSAAELGGVWNGKVYRLVNFYSDKALQVDSGVDANNRNVNQYTQWTSIQQQFKLVYNTAADAYKLYAMCSSNGTNRVVDVERQPDGSITADCNVQIWTPDDHETQFFKFVPYGDGYFYIVLRSNPNLVLTVYDATSGIASGRTATSPGNVFVTTKRTSTTGELTRQMEKQLWKLVPLDMGPSLADGVYEIQADFTNKVLTALANDNVVQAYPVQTQSQYFAVEYVSDGYYHITTRRGDGRRVTVESNNIVMRPPSDSDAQLFRIIPCGNNLYRIVSKKGADDYWCLNVENGSTANNANVNFQPYVGNSWQKWYFELMVPLSLTTEQQCANMGWDYVFENKNIMRSITNTYNPTEDSSGHRGIDIVSTLDPTDTLGTEIFSPTSGTVIYVNLNYTPSTRTPAQGYCVAIRTNNISPDTGDPIIVTFMHLNSQPTLRKDDIVAKGDLIGYVGNTGNSSGPHLHLETHSSGHWYSADDINHIYYPTIDPRFFFPDVIFLY